jgi:hypothetical protein
MLRKFAIAAALLIGAVAAYACFPRAPDLRAFDPAEMARFETAMWRNYYEKRYGALFYHLYESSRTQFGFSPLNSGCARGSVARPTRLTAPNKKAPAGCRGF